MKVAGIYIRRSVEADDASESLQAQEQRCIEFAKSQGFPEWEVYSDEHSGADRIRPGFMKLLKDAEDRKLDTILVWKFDRFSKSLLHSVDIFEDLKEWNVNLKSVTEPFDLQHEIGDMVFKFFMIFAEQERKSIKLRFRQGRENRMKQGLSRGGKIPRGYKYISPKKALELGTEPGLYTDEEQAGVVRKIFDLCVNEKLSCPRISHRLLADRVSLSAQGILDILKMECYATWI